MCGTTHDQADLQGLLSLLRLIVVVRVNSRSRFLYIRVKPQVTNEQDE